MSGHNAMRNEEVESTSDRLDSILDALNSLGGPAQSTKAPVRNLHPVPDLQDEDTEVDAESAPTAALIETEFEIPAPPTLAAVDVPETPPLPDLTPPAIPTFADSLGEVPEPVPVVEPEPVVESLVAPEPEPVSGVEPEPVVEPESFVAPEPEPVETSVAPEAIEFAAPNTEAHTEVPHTDAVTRPGSIFHSQAPTPEVAVEASVFAPEPVAETAPTEPVAETEEDEWVSHHAPEPTPIANVADMFADTTEPPADDVAPAPSFFDSVANLDPENPPEQLSGDALWHVETVEAPAEQDSASTSSPFAEMSSVVEAESSTAWSDASAELPESFMMADEIEQTLFDMPDEPVVLDFEPVESSGEGFATDDELPIPDFTGVYDRTPESDVWSLEADDGAVPLAESEESRNAAVARRAELDRLRPEDLPEGAQVDEEEDEDGHRKAPAIVLTALVILGFAGVYADSSVIDAVRDVVSAFRG